MTVTSMNAGGGEYSCAQMNYGSWLSRACGLVLVLALAGNAGATTIVGMNIDQVAQDAELIFEGEVILSEAREDSANGMINTYITFSILDVVKGDFNADTIELKFSGGSFNGQIMEVSGLTHPKLGEQGIYFVESTNRDLLNPLLGWSQGHYIIVDDNGVRRVSTVDSRPVTQIQPVATVPLSIRKPQKLIEGNADAAAGVVTETSPLMIERALSVDEFKYQIQSLIGN